MMEQKRPTSIIALGVIAVLVVFVVGCSPKGDGQETGMPGEEAGKAKSTPEPTQALEVNFSEAGNLLNWDSMTETYREDFVFLYEKPGAPALSVNLALNENSFCDLGEGEEICDKSKLNNGDAVRLEGNRVGDQVTVIKLRKLTTP